jgi:uncharacterized protein (TIGR02145 family)
MAENLNYATAEGSWCYDNQPSYCETYGRLYDWVTARTACPDGWHLPSYAEWDILVKYVDPNWTSNNIGSNVAGKKLKATSGWNNNSNGTDDFGFSALPGGFRYTVGNFDNAGYRGHWWSASESNASLAYYRTMYYDYEYADWNDTGKAYGLSVRCLQD